MTVIDRLTNIEQNSQTQDISTIASDLRAVVDHLPIFADMERSLRALLYKVGRSLIVDSDALRIAPSSDQSRDSSGRLASSVGVKELTEQNEQLSQMTSQITEMDKLNGERSDGLEERIGGKIDDFGEDICRTLSAVDERLAQLSEAGPPQLSGASPPEVDVSSIGENLAKHLVESDFARNITEQSRSELSEMCTDLRLQLSAEAREATNSSDARAQQLSGNFERALELNTERFAERLEESVVERANDFQLQLSEISSCLSALRAPSETRRYSQPASDDMEQRPPRPSIDLEQVGGFVARRLGQDSGLTESIRAILQNAFNQLTRPDQQLSDGVQQNVEQFNRLQGAIDTWTAHGNPLDAIRENRQILQALHENAQSSNGRVVALSSDVTESKQLLQAIQTIIQEQTQPVSQLTSHLQDNHRLLQEQETQARSLAGDLENHRRLLESSQKIQEENRAVAPADLNEMNQGVTEILNFVRRQRNAKDPNSLGSVWKKRFMFVLFTIFIVVLTGMLIQAYAECDDRWNMIV
eukprot:366013_1